VHRPQSLSNHSHRALLSINQEQNQSQRLIGFRLWQALRGTDCTFSLWLIVLFDFAAVGSLVFIAVER